MKQFRKISSIVLLIAVILTSTLNVFAIESNANIVRFAAVSNIITYKATTKLELQKIMLVRVEDFTENFSIQYTGDSTSIMKELDQIMEQMFLPGSYLYGTMSDYQWSAKGYEGDLTISFKFNYYHNTLQEDLLNSEVDIILSKIISTGMTDLEKVKAVNDYVVILSQYSYSNPKGISVHSPYSLIQGNQGVCQAYALLTFKMLERAGINVKYVVGDAGEPHAWNLVQIDSKWFHLDTTWNDPTPDRKGIVSYAYFLMSDEQIGKDHTWIKGDYPVAVDNKYAYLHKVGSAKNDKDYIYYIDKMDEKLYRIKLDGTNKLKVIEDRVNEFVIFEDKIYYNNFSYGGYLYSINTNGNMKMEINTEYSVDLDQAQGILYYTFQNSGIRNRMLLGDTKPVAEQPTAWAKAGIDKAKAYNLVDDYLLNNYSSNITRGEFCALVVNIYESISGKVATIPYENKFIDTNYSEILKAYELGIVSGISANKFDPKANITREQIAVMYNNLLVALDINPIVTQQYVFFNDEKNIANWAKNSVQTMFKLGIISGVGNDYINPKSGATREQAINLAVRLYEMYKK